MLNLKVSNPVLKDWNGIRYWVEFQMNGQQFNIDTKWKNEMCSFDDVIAHKGYSGVTTIPNCSYCGKSFKDCEICPEFYFNQVKTQIIVDQLVNLMQDQLKELPFNFETPFESNRAQKVLNMVNMARNRGEKILAAINDYQGYIVSGSVIAPDYDDLELLEDDDMFFMKTKYKVVNVDTGSETFEQGVMEPQELYSYLIPSELLDNSNPFADFEVEWKREQVISTLSYLDEHRRNSTGIFLRNMLERNFPKEAVRTFLEDWVSVDMLNDSYDIVSQFEAFMEEE